MKTHYFDTLCIIDFSNLQSNDNKLQNRLDGLVFKEAVYSWQLIDVNHLHLQLKNNNKCKGFTQIEFHLLLALKYRLMRYYPPGSIPDTPIAFSLCLLECLHFCISSVFLFRQVEGSESRIRAFSDKQTSHFLDPHTYGRHFFKISHLTVGVIPLSFRLQT